MSGRFWTRLIVSGGLALAVSAVALQPMVEEGAAVRSLRERFEIERHDATDEGERRATYRCGGLGIVVTDRPETPSPAEPPEPAVAIRVGDTLHASVARVRVREEARGADRYGNRVVPFRWTDRGRGREECGVAHRLPADTAAVARAREGRGSSLLSSWAARWG